MTDVNLNFLEDFEYSNDNSNMRSEKYQITFSKSNMFNYWNENVKNTNYTETFYIEGMDENNVSEYLVLYDNRLRKKSTSNKLILDDLNYDTDVSIFKDGYIINLEKNIVLGELFGNINIKACGITNIEDVEIICLRNDSKRLIGRYEIVNGKYQIPNLDVNSYYDIILVDKSRKIEQQVLSYRKPTPY